MRAIILAAGKGTRLFPLTRNTPKSLLDLGNGISLIENQLMSLTEANVKDIYVVVGYRADQIEAKIKTLDEIECNIETIYNPFIDVSNNLISLWFARHMMDEDFLIINGDDIFIPDVITGLLNAEPNNEICLTISVKDQYNYDDMKIIHKNNKIMRIGKNIPIDEANGESIGIMRISGKSKINFKKVMDQMVRDPDNLNYFYLSIFQQMIDVGWPIYYYLTENDYWAEVDFHPDLEFIRSNVIGFTKSWDIKKK